MNGTPLNSMKGFWIVNDHMYSHQNFDSLQEQTNKYLYEDNIYFGFFQIRWDPLLMVLTLQTSKKFCVLWIDVLNLKRFLLKSPI